MGDVVKDKSRTIKVCLCIACIMIGFGLLEFLILLRIKDSMGLLWNGAMLVVLFSIVGLLIGNAVKAHVDIQILLSKR